jgi:fumarylacetoacetase
MSWIFVAENHPFPVENLPIGIFSSRSRYHYERHIGIAIGDYVLDLNVIQIAGLLDDLGFDSTVFGESTLNEFMGLNRCCWRAARTRFTDLLSLNSVDDRLRGNTILQQVFE